MTPRARRAALFILVLAGCARHQERELTGWLKVDVVRPIMGTSGMIKVGSAEEVFYAKVGKSWKRLGSGHPCAYIVLTDPDKEEYEPNAQPIALVNLQKGKVQVAREGEEAFRPIDEVFAKIGNGPFSVPASRTAVDFWDCREPASPAGCRDLQIHRYDPRGRLVKTFQISVRETHPECRIQRLLWYGGGPDEVPYVNADCDGVARVQCLLLAPRKEGLFVAEVGRDRPPVECSEFPGLGTRGVTKSAPAQSEPLW